METIRVHWHPNVARAQIIVLVPYHADIFIAIPNIFIRDWSCRYGRSGHYNTGRRHNNRPVRAGGIDHRQPDSHRTGGNDRF